MTNQQYFKMQNRLRDQSWHGVSKRKAKGKSGNSGIHPRNGQIEQVGLEMIFNRPNWTKYQR